MEFYIFNTSLNIKSNVDKFLIYTGFRLMVQADAISIKLH